MRFGSFGVTCAAMLAAGMVGCGGSTPDAKAPHGSMAAAEVALAAHDCATATSEARLAMKESITSEGMIVLGACAEIDGHEDAAVAHYEDALGLDPRAVDAALRLGRLDLKLGRVQEAIAVLKRAVAYSNGVPTLWEALGDAYVRAGARTDADRAYTRAVTTYRLAVKARPDDVKLRLAYARALASVHHEAEARSEVVDAISIAGNDVPKVEEAALALSDLGDPARCVEALDRILVQSSAAHVVKDHAEILADRAKCKHAAHDLAGARADAQASLAMVRDAGLEAELARWSEEGL